jgi:hypothetical protein
LLTAIGLTPGGSNTVHIYKKTIHRTTQLTTITIINNRTTQLTTHRTIQITTNVEECGPCPVFASYTLAFAIQLREKDDKTSVRIAEGCQSARENIIYIK